MATVLTPDNVAAVRFSAAPLPRLNIFLHALHGAGQVADGNSSNENNRAFAIDGVALSYDDLPNINMFLQY
ncbi:hypothetical protein [Pararhizobium sp. DWP1-1-3]|uniref:hypothetical protein n=1 Tax=Pararhizobium sp. DWP1-1-3 TaxID=2804652 RepID=UPI003CF596C9